jgi:predicted DNA-binding transcriptional regulator YafY
VRALVKLEQVLPAHLRRRVAALGSATIAVPAGGPSVDPQHLTTIAAACRDFECLRFGYRSREGAATRREVEPHSLVNLGRRWYLVAWDRAREDWRTFRVDRLTSPAASGRRFTARPLPAKDPAAYVEQSLAGARSRYEARVTVHAAMEEIQARLPWLAGSLRRLDPERCEYQTADDSLEWLAIRVAMLGADIEVHEPRELIEHLRVLGERLGRAAAQEQ